MVFFLAEWTSKTCRGRTKEEEEFYMSTLRYGGDKVLKET